MAITGEEQFVALCELDGYDADAGEIAVGNEAGNKTRVLAVDRNS
jgi:hypothetical protein